MLILPPLSHAEIMLYGIAQAFGSASRTHPTPLPLPTPTPLPSCLTRVLCLALVSFFRFAEGAARYAARPFSNPFHTLLFSSHYLPLPRFHTPGFDKAVEECKFRMSRYGVTPNMLVLPPQMLLYMALAPEAKLTCAAIYFEYLNLLLVNRQGPLASFSLSFRLTLIDQCYMFISFGWLFAGTRRVVPRRRPASRPV